jgi:hypothetical protein
LIEKVLVDSKARVQIQLPGAAKLWSRRSFVKLDHQSAADADWLEIVHPLAPERMMALP